MSLFQPIEVFFYCKMVFKDELLNIPFSENWKDKIKKDYTIRSLNQSVLIDWNSKIVKNNCPSASNNVSELIDQLLVEMKKEKNISYL